MLIFPIQSQRKSENKYYRKKAQRATIYAEMAKGKFPKQIQLTGARSVGWHESAVVQWIESRQ